MTGDLATAPPEHVALADEVADLLVRANGGDADAEQDLLARYRGDDRLHPGTRVTSFSPYGGPGAVDLAPFENGPGG